MRWRSVEPTTSMSTARKQRWIDVSRAAGGVAWPRKNGLNGCMPAVVSSTDWSSAEGTSDAEGTARCPRSTKNSVKLRRISSDDVTEPTRARFYEVEGYDAGAAPSAGRKLSKSTLMPARSACRCEWCEVAGDPGGCELGWPTRGRRRCAAPAGTSRAIPPSCGAATATTAASGSISAASSRAASRSRMGAARP